MNSLLPVLARLQRQTPCVVITVVSTLGSTPREAGAKMIVTENALYGTIGGGQLEYQAIKIARSETESLVPQALRRFPLGASLGQCCGGLVELLFEPVTGIIDWLETALDFERQQCAWVRSVALGKNPQSRVQCWLQQPESHEHRDPLQRLANQLLDSQENTQQVKQETAEPGYWLEAYRAERIELNLFGAGHVGRAIVEVLRDLPLQIRWVDSREGIFPSAVANQVETICTDTPEAEVQAASIGAYFLVMTHSHALDQLLTEQILKRDDFNYFGLIGSVSKRHLFEARMQRRGMGVEKFERMVCPIGIDGIPGKQPAMIALSVAAQLMQFQARMAATSRPAIAVACR